MADTSKKSRKYERYTTSLINKQPDDSPRIANASQHFSTYNQSVPNELVDDYTMSNMHVAPSARADPSTTFSSLPMQPSIDVGAEKSNEKTAAALQQSSESLSDCMDVFDDEGLGIDYLISRDAYLWPTTHSTIGTVGANLLARRPVYPLAWPYGPECPLNTSGSNEGEVQHAGLSNDDRIPASRHVQTPIIPENVNRTMGEDGRLTRGESPSRIATRTEAVSNRRHADLDVSARILMVSRIKELQAQPNNSALIFRAHSSNSADEIHRGGVEPDRPKSFEVYDKNMIDALWFTHLDADSSTLLNQPAAVQMLYWEEKARRGQQPPDAIAQQRGCTPEHFVTTIYDEPAVDEPQEPAGPWDDESHIGVASRNNVIDGDIGTVGSNVEDARASAIGLAQLEQEDWKQSLSTTAHKRKFQDHEDSARINIGLERGESNVDRMREQEAATMNRFANPRKVRDLQNIEKAETKVNRGQHRPPAGEIRVSQEQGIHVSEDVLARPKHLMDSYATPPSVDVRIFGSLAVTSDECLKFLPNHFVWRGCRLRFHRNGWNSLPMARAILQARDLSIPRLETNLSSTINKAHRDSTRLKDKDRNDLPRVPVTDLSCANWVPPKLTGWNVRPMDYYVRDLAAGVRRENFPENGDDKGPLTWAIEYILDHPEWSWLKISDLTWFIRLKGFHRHALQAGPNAINPDTAALQRHKKALDAFGEKLRKMPKSETDV